MDRAVEMDDATALLDDSDWIGPDTRPTTQEELERLGWCDQISPLSRETSTGEGLMAELLCAGVLRVDEYDVLDPALPIVERAVDFRP